MSLRIDTVEWIADSLVIGDVGFGVLGSEIPATGDHGAGYAYNDLDLPTDANTEICGRITTWPSAGTLFAYEDTSFEFYGPDGTYSFEYQLYVDGVATGSPVTVSLQVGGVTHATSGALEASLASLAGTSQRYRTHGTVAELSAEVANVFGETSRIAGFVSHGTSGSLLSSVAQLSGTVSRAGSAAIYPSEGSLTAGVAQLSGVAARIAALVTHETSGALVAQAAQALGAASGAALFTQEQLAFLVQYMQENLMIPTPEQIAAAVLAALQGTTLTVGPVDVASVKGDTSIVPWPTAAQTADTVLNGVSF